ncbi:MAG: hypothetical protein U1F25_19670 [Rubrivivax sp.]
MKDDVAHTKMLAKPRDDSGGSCGTCHTADLAKIKTAYADEMNCFASGRRAGTGPAAPHCTLAFAAALPLAAPRRAVEFGSGSTLNITYSLQGWAQERGYTSATNAAPTTDMFLRRNRLTFSGQYNDHVAFYARLEASGDGHDGADDRSVFFATPTSRSTTATRCASSPGASRTPSRARTWRRAWSR